MDRSEIEFLDSCGIRPLEKIAHGSFGEVWKVYSFQYNSYFALKKILLSKFDEKEIECMKLIDHSYIVNLYNYYKFNDYVYMLLEYCNYDLKKYIASNETLCFTDKRRIISGCVTAVKACHDHFISHSDIKPSNFLFDKYNRIKLGDFGLSSSYKEEELCDSFRGTKVFMAPEIIKKIDFDPFKSDIWALGVTIYYIATGLYPFIANDSRQLYDRITSGVFSVDHIHDTNLIKVIRRCLDLNPQNRPTCEELLKMPFFLRGIPTGKSTLIKQSFSATRNLVLNEKICKPRVHRNSFHLGNGQLSTGSNSFLNSSSNSSRVQE
ncbi:CAMK family protein kinase [Trichomonas vaginalis G3]|uniref:CAMK family protein kinase n=1 Tax=Trichomonas vaginalis (strain ATCC PRA-98 / G3) TaxID=412133 RepID=A2G6P7_TRIV3|nr:protein serine/threonine kinase protein [Trichomonas vaginalis G3]EAX87171.1 CAMK family protein kinase [Trichomonas vaginalis G3]KAI5540218.1 protein serine/threonine kinase protein [Trichomonas vaginalis G3]|eukprot:XP_001300101.1 CAMK family protein kinase [Trichomonas vaginalis G3]